MATDKLVIFCTARDTEEAQGIAKALVKEKLAACVNILPKVKSIYRWKGKIEEDSEVMLMIKTSNDLLFEVKKWIKELHSYEVPEIIAFQPSLISGDYEAWMDEQLVDPSELL